MAATQSLARKHDPLILKPKPIFVGRQKEIAALCAVIEAGGSIALRGMPGSGRRALLEQLYERTCAAARPGDVVIRLTYQSAKLMVSEIAKQIHESIGLRVPLTYVTPRERLHCIRAGSVEYRHIHRAFTRAPLQTQMQIIVSAVREYLHPPRRGRVILFVEHLELPPYPADLLLALSEVGAQIVATVEATNSRNRIARLLWRFKEIHDIAPLSSREVREWVEQYIEREGLEFDRPRTRARFIATVVRTAQGKPAAVEQMLLAARCEHEITMEHVRDMDAEAAHVYLDMTPLVVIIVAIAAAARYVGRGASMEELLIIAGVGTSIFWVVLYILRLLGRKR